MNKPVLPPCSLRDCSRPADAIVEEAFLCGEHATAAYQKLLAKRRSQVVLTPREDRRAVSIPASVQRQSGVLVEVQVVNVSEHGCRVRYKKTLWVGERVELRLPGQSPTPAQVRWSLPGNAGLNFLDA